MKASAHAVDGEACTRRRSVKLVVCYNIAASAGPGRQCILVGVSHPVGFARSDCVNPPFLTGVRLLLPEYLLT